jgi:DNA repair exonuclease SbcCD nuclease subunit
MLGIELGDRSEAKLQQAYADAFQRLYRDLADRASSAYPGAALIATGHLTAYGKAKGQGPQTGDYHTPLHRSAQLGHAGAGEIQGQNEGNGADTLDGSERLSIGTLDALSPDIFDTRYSYVALGHIHRPMPVAGRRHIRYSGTPVATDRTESSPQRQVVLVDVSGDDEATLCTLPVPIWRDLVVLKDTPEAVGEALRTLTSDAQLPPAVFVDLLLGPEDPRGRNWSSELHAVLDERAAGSGRPHLVEVREIAAAEAIVSRVAPMPPLEHLTPEDVFRAMYRRKHASEEGIDTLLPVFRELVQGVIDQDGGEA